MVAATPQNRPRVLLVYADTVGSAMGSVGIRAYELAQALQRHAEVSLAVARADEPERLAVPTTTFLPHDPRALRDPLRQADMVLAQPQWPLAMRLMERSGARLVFDLYDPETFPTIQHLGGSRAILRRTMTAFSVDRMAAAMRIGHHLVCATETQRDMWIGTLLGRRHVTPEAYDRDPTFRDVVDTVPFGLPTRPPDPARRGAIRRRFPQLDAEDEIVLWNGGIWRWFDPQTAIRAIAELSARRPRVKLVFMGATRFGPARAATAEAIEFARTLGLLGETVLFNDEWVPYEERDGWLLDARCALSTHADHLETRFSSRTRVLDCIWTGVPVVCTTGDELGELAERHGLGRTVPPGDATATARALDELLDLPPDPRRAEGLARRLAWESVVEPLVRWMGAPGVPERIGAGGPAFLDLGMRTRSAGYTAIRTGLNAVGLGTWPKL